MIRIVLAAIIVVSGWSGGCAAGVVDLGTVGKVYPIEETDYLTEIQEKIHNMDWQAIRQKHHEKLVNFRPHNPPKLPRATVARKFRVDVSHTLKADIPNGEGGILYPKGYTFNPLDYVNYTETLIIIDANDEAQLQWLEASAYKDDPACRLLLTDGPIFDLKNRMGRPLFLAGHNVVQRLKLQALPSIIRQDGSCMEVSEVVVAVEK
jgi:conjugal transfer pilus assembly protein TraW